MNFTWVFILILQLINSLKMHVSIYWNKNFRVGSTCVCIGEQTVSFRRFSARVDGCRLRPALPCSTSLGSRLHPLPLGSRPLSTRERPWAEPEVSEQGRRGASSGECVHSPDVRVPATPRSRHWGTVGSSTEVRPCSPGGADILVVADIEGSPTHTELRGECREER